MPVSLYALNKLLIDLVAVRLLRRFIHALRQPTAQKQQVDLFISDFCMLEKLVAPFPSLLISELRLRRIR